MVPFLYKTKQYLLATAKVLILGITFGYIYYKLRSYSSVDFMQFTVAIFSKGIRAGYLIFLFFVLAAANWALEILKWKMLVSSFKKISYKTALKQCLASFTVSLATPNRIGEYGAKALFFEPQKRKKVLLLNLYSNSMQMLATTFFGIFGLFYLAQRFQIIFSEKKMVLIILMVLLFFYVGFILKKKKLFIKGFTIEKAYTFFKKLPSSVKIWTVLLSVVRYLIFCSSFYGLLLFFGAKIMLLDAFFLIFAMYLLASIIPTIFIFDVAIGGGIAVWLFSFVQIPEIAVLMTVLTMWILNFVIPAFFGSFYILTFSPKTQ